MVGVQIREAIPLGAPCHIGESISRFEGLARYCAVPILFIRNTVSGCTGRGGRALALKKRKVQPRKQRLRHKHAADRGTPTKESSQPFRSKTGVRCLECLVMRHVNRSFRTSWKEAAQSCKPGWRGSSVLHRSGPSLHRFLVRSRKTAVRIPRGHSLTALLLRKCKFNRHHAGAMPRAGNRGGTLVGHVKGSVALSFSSDPLRTKSARFNEQLPLFLLNFAALAGYSSRKRRPVLYTKSL